MAEQLERPCHTPLTTAWRNEIQGWEEAKRSVKEQSQQLDQAATGEWLVCLPRKVAFFMGYFVALAVALWILMVLTCPRGWGLNGHTGNFWDIFIGAWNFGNAPWGWLFLFSSILETAIFVVACVIITWPEKPQAPIGVSPDEVKPTVAAGQGSGQACLLIACHNSSIDTDAQADITRTIRAALRNFPPESIFVCDNGGGLHPSDDTQGLLGRLCDEVCPGRRVNYVYIPEGD